MKKITYSIAVALILSVILALIFPTWFLTEDARWTYSSDVARMDISIGGNVKNGWVRAEGANVRITQPKWLSGKNFQGTMVELPASYRKSSYQIRLTPLADTASQDATLVIKFLGNIVQDQGQRMPARVTFRNLTLNGELIAAEKTVWHDQPFRLQRPFHPSESITLAFDVYKPLGASDFSYVNFLVAFLTLCIFSMAALRFKTAASRVLDFFCNKDIVQVQHSMGKGICSIVTTSIMSRFAKSWKIMVLALMSTLVANILCLPLWTEYDVMGFICTPSNSKVRMDILYSGSFTGAEAFSITSAEPSLSALTNYIRFPTSQVYRVDLPIEGEWKSYSFTLKAHRKGNIDVRLKGPYQCNEYGERYSIAVDYKNLWINGKGIFSDRRRVTHAKDFSYRTQVNAGDAIKISFKARRHHFDAEDFNLLKGKNFWYIITLSIVVFSVSYILLQRISKISRKRKKQGDAVFLVIFFLLLAVPLSDISDAKRSTRELRTLKERPKVSLILKENANFGKEFDDWFCDHLGGREYLLKLHDVVKRGTQRILRTSHQTWYFQDDGWLFVAPFAWFPSPKLVQPIVKSFSDLKSFCDANNIKLYVLVVPLKCSIYQEHLYGYGRNMKNCVLENNFHGQIKQLAQKQHVPYIYPWTELREACRHDYTFFKLTHHWTDWGAYIGYRALMKEIHRDFPDIPVVSLEDYRHTRSYLIRDERERHFGYGNLIRYFNFNIDYGCPITMYNYYDHKNADKLVLNMGEFTEDFRYGGGAYKIMVLGTSQSENLMGFLPYSAAQTKYIRLNSAPLPSTELWKIMKYYKKDILSYKPDILILSLGANADNVLNIQNFFKE